MRLLNVEFSVLDELDPLYTLKKLYDVTGNCLENGLLAEEFTNCEFDDEHRLMYFTSSEKDGNVINSQGVVLLNSVLIRQVQSVNDDEIYNIYSWNTFDNVYTKVTFDNKKALNNCFGALLDNHICLCDVDVEETFNKLNIPVDSVRSVKKSTY